MADKIDRDAPAAVIVEKFGGLTKLARAIGRTTSTVQWWMKSGHIPGRHYKAVMEAAKREKVKLVPADFVKRRGA